MNLLSSVCNDANHDLCDPSARKDKSERGKPSSMRLVPTFANFYGNRDVQYSASHHKWSCKTKPRLPVTTAC